MVKEFEHTQKLMEEKMLRVQVAKTEEILSFPGFLHVVTKNVYWVAKLTECICSREKWRLFNKGGMAASRTTAFCVALGRQYQISVLVNEGTMAQLLRL